MNPNREEALFELALEKPVEKRTAFLDAMCEGDAALRARLDALLAAHEQPDGLNSPSPDPDGPTMKIDSDDEPRDETIGSVIGHYKVLQNIGEGGCGAVYLAEQQEPVRRRVALKVIKLGMDTKAVIARFEAERQALALMDHPNIAKVLDAGSTDTGRPYFVMELVRGIKITDYCDQNKLDAKQRLELFIRICQAIQHAHQKGIIHRDIKPSNVLVTLHDGIPLPKVIDFGIAKATTDQPLTDKTLFTAYEQFIGTPAYMSPEQAEMSPDLSGDIDTRSDIYSLGVLLYELLTGKTPFDPKELMKAGVEGMRRTIREVEPLRPSTRLTQLAASQSQIKNQKSKIENDLDWIVMKCLEKDRTRRYETANGLAMDLKRHLNNETVVARPPSKFYEFQKTVRRHKVGFAATAAIIVALAAGVVGSAWQAHLAQVARQQAESEAVAAEAINAFFNDMLASVDPRHLREYSGFAIPRVGVVEAQGNLSHDISVVQMLLGATQRIAQAFAGKPELEATARERIGLSLLGLGRPREAADQLGIAAEIRSNNPDANDPETLRSELQYAMSLIGSGREPEAIPLLRKLRQQMTQAFGALDPRTLQSSSLYATALMRDRKHDKSDPIFRETLKRQTEILGPEHRDTIETRIWWCNSFEWRGRGGEAEALVRPAYETALRVYGPDDVQTLFARSQVGMSLTFQGRTAEAEAMLRPAVQGLARLVGDEHPFTCVAKSDLSRCLQDTSDETLQLLREALEGLHVSEGKASPWIYVTSRDLAFLLLRHGRTEEGLSLMRRAVEDFRDKYGVDNEWTVDNMYYLEEGLRIAGDLTEEARVRKRHLVMRGVDASEVDEIWDRELALTGPLRKDGFRFSLTRLDNGKYSLAVENQPLIDLSFVKDAPVEELHLFGTSVDDLRPLANLALTKLDIRRTSVTDLSPLRAPVLSASLRELYLWLIPATDFSPITACTNLDYFDAADTSLANLGIVRGRKLRVALLTGTKITDISLLAGMPLEKVTLDRTAVTDISPLLQCPTLRELVLPPRARDVKALRALPALKTLSYGGGFRTQTVEEFWSGEEGYGGLTAKKVSALSKESIQNPQDSLLAMKVAALQAWFGLDAEYAATCKRAIEAAERAPKTEDVRERAAKNWCLRPSDDAAMLPRVVALAREAAKAELDAGQRPWYQQVLGMAEFRAGNDHAAETAFIQAEKAAETGNWRPELRPFVQGPSRFYRAMILFRQGKQEEAKQLFHEAEAQMRPVPVNADRALPSDVTQDHLLYWLAYKEAGTLLQIPATTAKP